jgi:glycosyltransferase involved in cell wall biosynthesis
MTISVCVPTIRPQNVPALKEKIMAEGLETEFLWEEDIDRLGCPRTLKKLTDKAKGERICFVGDDTEPQPNMLKEAMKCMDDTGAWLVGFNDFHGQKATHWLADVKLLDHLENREFFYTGYIHNADPELEFRAKMLGKYVWCHGAQIKHDHPAFGTAQTSPDYERVLSQDVNDHDYQLFLERCRDDRPLLGFTMIVKNEADNIAKTIASVKPYIDYWCILDTGSTDGTQDIIRKELEGIPGVLHEEPFVDFSTSRNRALDLLGRTTIFSLMLSGNETLTGGEFMREYLKQHARKNDGAYMVRVTLGDAVYKSPRLGRTNSNWRYVKRTHEVMLHPYAIENPPYFEAVHVFHDRSHVTNPAKSWQRDLLLLQQDLFDDPNDTRAAFYLAQSYDCMGLREEAYVAYKRRIAMGGWNEEVYESKYRMANLMAAEGQDWDKVMLAYLEAFKLNPRRAEPLYKIGEFFRKTDQMALAYLFAKRAYDLPYPDDILFIDGPTYEWKVAELVGITAFYVGEKEVGKQALQQIINKYGPDDARRKLAESNLKFYEGPN